MRLALLLAVLLTGSPALAGEPTADDPPVYQLTGRVVDEAGKGVAGAEVFVQGREAPYETLSDEVGNFRFPLSTRQWYSLPSRTFLQAGRDTRVGYAPILRGSEKHTEPVTITLKEARQLAVQVRDEEGRPVADAIVHLLYFDTLESGMPFMEMGRTDAEGNWTTRILPKVSFWQVFAFKPGKAIHGQALRGEKAWAAKAHESPNTLSLVLGNARKLRIKTVDNDGNPIPKITVMPISLKITGQDLLNPIPDSRIFPKTDDNGLVILDWLPINLSSLSVLAIPPGMSSRPKLVKVDVQNLPDELSIELIPTESISGMITNSEGKPIPEVRVHAKGRKSNRDSVLTDDEGRYSLNVRPNEAYHVYLESETWGAPWKWPVIVESGKPAFDINFLVKPTTKVFGKVTSGKENKPASKVRISVSSVVTMVPDGTRDRAAADILQNRTQWWSSSVETNENGNYAFHLGPGVYSLTYPDSASRGKPMTIHIREDHPPAEIERDFQVDRAPTRPLKVTVVDETDQPVPGAQVVGAYQSTDAICGWLGPTTTDHNGVHETERSLEKLVLQASSGNGKLKGIARLDATASEVTLKLAPTGRLTGTIKDLDGEAVANQRLWYGIQIPIEGDRSGLANLAFGAYVETDAEGAFRIAGLVIGEKYDLRLAIGIQNRTVAEARVPESGVLELGEIVVDLSPALSYMPPPPKILATTDFKKSPDIEPDHRLRWLLERGERMYTTPMVVIGRPAELVK